MRLSPTSQVLGGKCQGPRGALGGQAGSILLFPGEGWGGGLRQQGPQDILGDLNPGGQTSDLWDCKRINLYVLSHQLGHLLLQPKETDTPSIHPSTHPPSLWEGTQLSKLPDSQSPMPRTLSHLSAANIGLRAPPGRSWSCSIDTQMLTQCLANRRCSEVFLGGERGGKMGPGAVLPGRAGCPGGREQQWQVVARGNCRYRWPTGAAVRRCSHGLQTPVLRSPTAAHGGG